jgi:sarcosine oxidase, subunit beta
MADYDVGIVGAGVHGASAARHLAERGVRVAVYERDAPASGPTGFSSAICRAYYTNPFLAKVAHESLDLLSDFGAFTDGGHSDFRRTGALFLHPPEDADAVRQTVRMLGYVGTHVEIIEGTEIDEYFPGLDRSGIALAVTEPDAGFADPVATTQALLAHARRLGADVRPHTRVTAIEPGPTVRVVHDAGHDTVERLLVAAGPWTAPLAATAGVTLPLVAERHVVARCAFPSDVTVPHVFADLAEGYYFKPEPGDQFLLGPLHPTRPFDLDDRIPGIDHGESSELVRAVSKRVPALRDATLTGGWASLYDVSPDWQPVIGKVAENVFVDTGTSGHGFKLAPALGGYIADMVLGHPDAGLDQFHPDRFRHDERLASGYGSARIIG